MSIKETCIIRTNFIGPKLLEWRGSTVLRLVCQTTVYEDSLLVLHHSLSFISLAALAACHYLPQMREKIFTVLYKVAVNGFYHVSI